MTSEEHIKEKLWILVKAYPQPSQKYQETVCCAAITEKGKLLRLYPIRYRHLKKEQQFGRFDLLELILRKNFTDRDKRPESYKVDEESIRILRKGKSANSASKSSLWLPFVSESLDSLKDEQKSNGKSIGIIKPDKNTLNFIAKPVEQEDDETKEIIKSAYNQASLFEDNLAPLERPEYVFYYRFNSTNTAHKMQIHDWEVQATYRNYKKRYGNAKLAIEKMTAFYNKEIISQNPHLLMGNMMRSPWQFMIIGILRTSNIEQKTLFDLI